MDAIIYKCENCGAPLVFDAKTGKLTCNYCRSEYTKEDLEARQHPVDLAKDKEKEPDSGMREFVCEQCGAALVTDESTSATFCTFCGSPTVIPRRLSGVFKPEKVIPFKIDKRTAEGYFEGYLKGRPFLPQSFKTFAQRNSLSGIYAPFWLYNAFSETDVTADAETVHTYVSGKYRITDTAHYKIERTADMRFANVPADASQKMDDELMKLIEPFNFNELKDFSMTFLSGFLAEKYDSDKENTFPRAKPYIERFSNRLVQDTITGYTRVHNVQASVSLKNVSGIYALLPVWIMCYRYKDKVYTFAINGQTGRMVGKLPVSWERAALIFLGVFLVASLIIFFGLGVV